MSVDAPLRVQPPDRLARALRVLGAGPRPCYRAALTSVIVTALLTLVIAGTTRPAGPLPGPQHVMIAAAAAAICVAAGLWLGSVLWPALARQRRADRVIAPAGRAAVWLALAIWVPLLLVPEYLLAEATKPPAIVRWNTFGFLDKRWETTAFLIGTLGPMLALVIAVRVIEATGGQRRTLRDWLRVVVAVPEHEVGPAEATDLAAGAETAASPRRWRPAARVTAGVLTAAALGWYFYGPPWYLYQNRMPITGQDDLWLGGLQAIARGHVPFIGPAAVQYGPGTQLLSYLYLRDVGPFSVLGFRESWAMLQWAGATIFLITLFLAFGYLRGLLAALLAVLVYPTLQLLGFQHGNAYGGLFGWANPLRYAGAFALVVLLPGVIRRGPGRLGIAAGFGLGAAWGALCYVAQENLIGGLLGALAIAALLALSGTCRARSVVTALAAVLTGAVTVWLPVLGYYAAHGVLGRFAWLYFLVPRAVASGYSNTPFKYGLQNPWAATFYAFPFVLAVLGVASILRFRPLRIAVAWSRQRTMLVAALVSTVVLYEGALLRSDTVHLSGTMLAAPGLVAVAATTLPGRFGARRPVTLALGGVTVLAAAFAMLPAASYRPSAVGARLEAPYLDRVRMAGRPVPATPENLAGRRVGAGLAAAPVCCPHSTLAMPGLIALMNRIHAIVGNRVSYVADVPAGYPGLVYFTADLSPAPISLEPYTMVLNTRQAAAYLVTFKASVLTEVRALLTSSLRNPETRAFLTRYPDARRIRLDYLGKPFYVLLG